MFSFSQLIYLKGTRTRCPKYLIHKLSCMIFFYWCCNLNYKNQNHSIMVYVCYSSHLQLHLFCGLGNDSLFLIQFLRNVYRPKNCILFIPVQSFTPTARLKPVWSDSIGLLEQDTLLNRFTDIRHSKNLHRLYSWVCNELKWNFRISNRWGFHCLSKY